NVPTGTRRGRRLRNEGQYRVHQHEADFPGAASAESQAASSAHPRAAMPAFTELTPQAAAPAGDVSRETSKADDAFARRAADADTPLAAELIETERRRRELE